MHLAQPGDPLVEADGSLTAARGQLEPSYSREIPIARTIQTKVPLSVREMGTDAQTQTVVNAVLMYHLIGVGTNEIAYVMNTSPTEIEKVKVLPAFQDTFERLFKNIINTNQNSLQARIQAMAGKALGNLMDLADAKPVAIVGVDEDGNKYTKQHYDVPPVVIQRANDSILDRAGLSGELLFGQKDDSSGQELEIEITTAEDNKTNVKVNVGTRK